MKILAIALALSAATPVVAQDNSARADYPTREIGDYIVGCMAANGESRDMLDKCACSIDVITTLLPYDKYEEAETFLSVGQTPGERGVIFRTSEPAKAAIGALRAAQVEAELRCF